MVGNILAVGLMSLGMGMSGIKDEPQMYAQDESTYSITYTAEEWAEKADDILNWLWDNRYGQMTGVENNYLDITGSLLTTTVEDNDNLSSMQADKNNHIIKMYAGASGSGHQWTYNTETDALGNYMGGTRTINTITIVNEDFYNEFAVEQPTMGDSIIGSIASGLGLIGALATEFLAGFGALFYVQGALTPFAIFSLVMLGVAVSFAVVKLVLNLIRSNTGA